jgi:uncharacterized protein YggE
MSTVKALCTLLAVLTTATLSACSTLPSAQAVGQRTIVVDGEARLQAKPDTFSVAAKLITTNSDQAAGLAELSAKLDRIRQTLPQLEGLKNIQIDTSDMKLGPIYEPACVRDNQYGSTVTCPVTGRIGEVELQINASPADRAGQFVSLLSQLGADSIELRSFSISDEKAWKEKAVAAAVDDARAKASSIAGAAGATITGLERVQYGGGFDAQSHGVASAFSITAVYNDELQPSTTVIPTVDLNIAPTPIEVSATVTVAFGLKN